MSPESQSHRPCVFVTGECEGLDDVLTVLGHHPAIELLGSSARVRDASRSLADPRLDVVLHATRSSALPASDLSAIREYTSAPIVLLAAEDGTSLLDSALEADLADVLLMPAPDKIVFAVRKAAATPASPAVKSGERGKILTVFAPKGGIGKTVTSTNIAACLGKREGRRTLLVDLDLQFGDAAIVLGLEPKTTIYDLVVAPGELDSEKLAGYTAHHGSGLHVLPAPLRPEDAELVTEAKLTALLDVAREAYDAVVVDTSPFFHGPNLAALDRTDELLLLCAPEVPTVKNVRLGLETLALLKFPRERIRLVLNRANSEVGMKSAEVEQVLEVPVEFQLPSERAVPMSVNRGKPLVLADPSSEFSRAIEEIARSVISAPPSPAAANDAPRRRWLPSLSRS